MENTIRILVWLYTAKMNKKNLSPIRMRITVNGGKTEFSTGLYIKTSEWDNINAVIKGKTDDVREMNKHLENMRTRIMQIFNELQSLQKPISAEIIRKKFNNIDNGEKSLLYAISYHMELLEARIGIDANYKTFRKYASLKHKIERYLRERLKRNDIFLKELNHQFVVEFEHFLKTVFRLAHNSCMKDIQFLKKIIHL